jgi:hypothetical protein
MAGKKERIFRHCNEPLLKILKLWLLYDSYVSRWSMECFTGLVAKLNLTFLFFFFWFPEISSFVHVGSLGLSLEGFPSNWRSAEQQNCFEKKSAIYGWNWNKGCPLAGAPNQHMIKIIWSALHSLWHASFCFAYLSVMCNGWQNVVGTHPHAMQVHSMQPLALFHVWAAASAHCPVCDSSLRPHDWLPIAMLSQDHRWLNCHVTRDREGLEFRSGGDGGWPGETR